MGLVVLGLMVSPIIAAPPPNLERQLQAALAKLPHAQTVVGACVMDVATGRVVYARNADQPLVPASAHKLFAMSAALAELEPQFAFETLLALDGRNLIVVGDGDPGFGDPKVHAARAESITAPFDQWAEALKRSGVAIVPGDLIIDESIFDDERLHPTWEKDDLGSWYAAPVGGLNLNDNCLDITIHPAGRRNALVSVSVQPPNSLVQIVNTCRSGGRGEPTLHHAFDSFSYAISGRSAKRWTFGAVSFPDPGLLFADSLRTVLATQGITLRGGVRRERVRRMDGALPGHIAVVARHRTPIADCLARAGKDSQNLFAECLLKRAGYAWALRHHVDDPRGTWSFGQNAVRSLLHRAGIDTSGLSIADGSGLSRKNACTARQLAAVLAASYAQPYGLLLHDSLATAGVDGSLRKRLKNSDGRVHAKTGTMRGIRTLAGYVDSDAGPRFAFAVLFNGYKGPSTPYKDIQDRFCRILSTAAVTQTASR